MQVHVRSAGLPLLALDRVDEAFDVCARAGEAGGG